MSAHRQFEVKCEVVLAGNPASLFLDFAYSTALGRLSVFDRQTDG